MKRMLLAVFLLSVFLVGCAEQEMDSGIVKEVNCIDGNSSFKSTVTLDDNKKYYIHINDCRLIIVGTDIKVIYDDYNMRVRRFEYSKKNEIPPESE